MTGIFRTAILTALLALSLGVQSLSADPNLEEQAALLVDDFDVLLVKIDNCPGGECETAATIVATFDQLDVELVDLQGERAAMGECIECQELDALLDEAAADATLARTLIGDWEDED